MRRIAGLVISILVALLCAAAPSDAQPAQTSQPLRYQGTIQAVDCDAQQVMLAGGTGPVVLQSTLATEIRVNSTASSLCSLQSFVGALATAWIMVSGGQLIVARLEVSEAPVVPVPPQPVPYAPASGPPVVAPQPSLAGLVLGTILIGGLTYLLVHAANGTLYRYPYDGRYRENYYQPSYHPYAGPYRTAPAYTYGPYRRCPNNTWSQWCR